MASKPNVFINCPFDDDYSDLFDAIVFTVQDCGFVARCAREEEREGVRLARILQIIEECPHGIHDLSRTELDEDNKLPRFNMPLELGMFLAAKHFGSGEQKKKRALILDREPYRVHKFCSDLAGYDAAAHKDEPAEVIRIVRDWLQELAPTILPGGMVIYERFVNFTADLPIICAAARLDKDQLTFRDLTNLIEVWTKKTPL